MRHIHFEELLHLGLVEHDWILVDHIYLDDCVPCLAIAVQLQSELFDVFWGDRDILLNNVHIEVGSVVVHVGCHRVTVGIDPVQPDHWLACVLLLVYKLLCHASILTYRFEAHALVFPYSSRSRFA